MQAAVLELKIFVFKYTCVEGVYFHIRSHKHFPMYKIHQENVCSQSGINNRHSAASCADLIHDRGSCIEHNCVVTMHLLEHHTTTSRTIALRTRMLKSSASDKPAGEVDASAR